jgi:hypothetical protein
MSALYRLIRDCQAMDITNQINTFGDAFLPEQARADYAKIKAQLKAAEKLLAAAIDYKSVSTYPIVQDDYCFFCDGDYSHDANCKFVIIENALESAIGAFQKSKAAK